GRGEGTVLQRDLADAADGRQCFAAKAERADTEQIVGAVELAGGVAGEGERQIVRGNAATVVDDANEFGAALLDVDIDPCSARIHAVFEEFLYHAGGTL